MYKEQYGKLIAEIAKDIVIAHPNAAATAAGDQGGKQLADFYNALYHSIYESLSKDLLTE